MASRPAPDPRPASAAPAAPVGESVRREGAREQIALRDVVTLPGQHVALSLRLHAFGHHGQPQSNADLCHRSAERLRTRILGQVTGEAAVQLELGDGQTAQVAQRREAGAEVVH